MPEIETPQIENLASKWPKTYIKKIPSTTIISIISIFMSPELIIL